MPFEFDPAELGLELTDEQKQAIEAKFNSSLESEVSGLKGKNSELIQKEKALKEQMKQYDGVDPQRARELEKMLAENEEARLISEGKLQEVIDARTERMRTEYERRNQEMEQQLTGAKTFAEKFRGRVLSDEVRAAAGKLGDVADSAAEDAAFRAQMLFEVNDEGQVVPKESAGLDANGKPLTVESWLASMRESAPHWFLRPQGAGAPGSGSSSASPKAWKDANSLDDKVSVIRAKLKSKS